MRPFGRLRARLGHYYWLPCEICGRMHGGFEAAKGGELLVAPDRSLITCPRCPHTYVRRGGSIYQVAARLAAPDEWPELLLRHR